MNNRLLWVVGLAFTLFASSCKKEGTTTQTPVQASELSFKASGVSHTAPSPANIDSLTNAGDDVPIPAAGFAMPNDSTILIVAGVKSSANDSLLLFMSAKHPKGNPVGTFQLNWTFTSLLANLQGGGVPDALPFNCFFGRIDQLTTVFAGIDPTNPLSLLQFASWGGNGSVTITKYDATKNQITGTFGFTTNMSAGRVNLSSSVTEGKFTNINKGTFF